MAMKITRRGWVQKILAAIFGSRFVKPSPVKASYKFHYVAIVLDGPPSMLSKYSLNSKVN